MKLSLLIALFALLLAIPGGRFRRRRRNRKNPPVQALAQSSWMAGLGSYIENKKINEIDIPGVHHAGFINVPWFDSIQGVWTICQGTGISANLNDGARFLDLRYGEFKNEIFFTHTFRSDDRLVPGLEEVKRFLDANRGEIVILQFSYDVDYKSNTNTARPRLMDKVKEIFGTKILSRTEYLTLTYSELVKLGRQVVLVGDVPFDVAYKARSWGTTQDSNWGQLVSKLTEYIQNKGRTTISGNSISVISAAVTPEFGKEFSWPKKVAGNTNAALIQRLPGISGRIGVIEHDFFDKTLANVIIEHNRNN